MARINTLTNFLNDVADSIRTKTGDTANISPANFDTEIASIPTGYTPPTSTGFANDSWATIAEISEHGLAAQFYNIGDTKTIATINATDSDSHYSRNWAAQTITVRIVGFNHFKLASDTTKKAGIVLMVAGTPHSNVMPALYQIDGGGGYFGWPGDTSMRAWLGNVFYNALPTTIKPYVKQIVTYNNNSYSDNIVAMSEYITLPSSIEFGITSLDSGSPSTKELDYQQPLPGIATVGRFVQHLGAQPLNRVFWTRSQTVNTGRTRTGVRYDSQLAAGTIAGNYSGEIQTTTSSFTSPFTASMCILPMFCI